MDYREYEEFQKFRKKKKRRKIRRFILTFILVLLLVLIFGAILLWQAGPLKHRAAEAVTGVVLDSAADTAAQQIGQAAGGAVSSDAAKQQIQQALDAMSDEDREALTGIIENHMDGSEITDITRYIMSGDTESAAEYAEEHLSPEETQELQDLLNKYMPMQ